VTEGEGKPKRQPRTKRIVFHGTMPRHKACLPQQRPGVLIIHHSSSLATSSIWALFGPIILTTRILEAEAFLELSRLSSEVHCQLGDEIRRGRRVKLVDM